MTNDKIQCLACTAIIEHAAYPMYKEANASKHKAHEDHIEQSEIIGYLCESCRTKQKIKPLRGINELSKLAKLLERE